MTEVFISFSYFKSVQSKSFAIRKTFKPIRENPAIRGKSGAAADRLHAGLGSREGGFCYERVTRRAEKNLEFGPSPAARRRASA
jgi:hypothetical protein